MAATFAERAELPLFWSVPGVASVWRLQRPPYGYSLLVHFVAIDTAILNSAATGF
jgi:hypothetical protein